MVSKTGRKAQALGRELWNGDRIREIREARGLSQKVLSELTGVSKGDISRHERNDGKSNPSIAALIRIALALDVGIAALFQPVGTLIPRPGEEPVRVERTEGDPLLAALAARLHENAPVEDSWRGDVLQALYVLNRALNRPADAGDVVPSIAKAGR